MKTKEPIKIMTLWGFRVLDEEEYWKEKSNEQGRPATRQWEVGPEYSKEFIKLIRDRRAKIEKKYSKRKPKHNRPHPNTIQEVLKRDNHTCLECGSKDHLEVHHMVYRSHGGTHELDNLITLCWLCHAEKHKDEPVYKLMMKRITPQ